MSDKIRVEVKQDSFKGWLVICSVCGVLSAYANFHVARREQEQHAEDGHAGE